MSNSKDSDIQQPSELIVVGKIRGTWGLRGDLRVETLTDIPGRFNVGEVLSLEGEQVKIVRSRPSNKGLIVGLDTVKNRTMAEQLRGKELTIPIAQVSPLPEGSFYYFQLLGIGVCSDIGVFLGNISDIIATEGNDIYVVSLDGRKEDVLVPALKDIVLSVELQEKKMVVKLPEIL